MTAERVEVDVVIVGAGLAGLAAARDIVAAGRRVVVLEARDRVGGRVINREIGDGKVVEQGGQWVGPTQDRILALAKDMGVEKSCSLGATTSSVGLPASATSACVARW